MQPRVAGVVQASFLIDGGQAAPLVTEQLVAFLDAATRSLDAAIYDFHASDGSTQHIADALEGALARGVQVRVAFNVDASRHASPRPMQAHPSVIDGLAVPTRAIRGEGALMHHKYVVRDAKSVWTGSTNWTDDSFSREENVIVVVDSPAIASAYTSNFERMWSRERLAGTGGGTGPTALDGQATVRASFSPDGPSLAHMVARLLGTAEHRIRIVSPVITAGAILGTLTEFAGRRSVDVAGAYDATQMDEVVAAWHDVDENRWKIDAWRVIAPRLSGKRSTPYAPGATHDYMHAKAVIVGDDVITGSFNCSRHGEDNAENVLHITSPSVAERFASFADVVAQRYAT